MSFGAGVEWLNDDNLEDDASATVLHMSRSCREHLDAEQRS